MEEAAYMPYDIEHFCAQVTALRLRSEDTELELFPYEYGQDYAFTKDGHLVWRNNTVTCFYMVKHPDVCFTADPMHVTTHEIEASALGLKRVLESETPSFSFKTADSVYKLSAARHGMTFTFAFALADVVEDVFYPVAYTDLSTGDFKEIVAVFEEWHTVFHVIGDEERRYKMIE